MVCWSDPLGFHSYPGSLLSQSSGRYGEIREGSASTTGEDPGPVEIVQQNHAVLDGPFRGFFVLLFELVLVGGVTNYTDCDYKVGGYREFTGKGGSSSVVSAILDLL